MRTGLLTSGSLLMLLSVLVITPASAGTPSYGISYFGDLKYPKDFTCFDYANPDAPKGSRMRTLGTAGVAVAGSFNNLHRFVDKGMLASGMDGIYNLIYDRPMNQSQDELSSHYGNLAESVEVPDDYTWVAYTLRQNAYWHDGVLLTVEDVIWTPPSLGRKKSRVVKCAHTSFAEYY